MNRLQVLPFVSMMFVLCGDAVALDLHKGLIRENENWNELTGFLYARGYYPFSVFVNESDSELIAFRTGVSIYDLTTKKKKFGKNVARWPYLQLVPEVLADHLQAGVAEWKGRIEYTSRLPFAGCLNRFPLRYGDIEGDGEKEIVLTLNGELIVFSPKHQRTVFAAFYDADDWYREAMENVTLESDVLDGESYQHVSEHLIYNGYSHRAHRAYTKLYIGDYDGDGNSDILTWQKVYVSNKVGEAAGFHLIRNRFKHFERDLKVQEETEQGITGEYLPQETNGDAVQQWLVERELTWKHGFPSASECKGEEGSLIREMHDASLNDPDVLE